MTDLRIDGVVPVISTPFRDDETIDADALSRLVDFAIECGNCAACLPAYGSEFYKLSDDERLQVVALACEHAAGRIPLFAQSNHPSARVAADMARRNADAGANAISVALPRQFAVSEDDLLRYSERIASATALPLLIQDFNPGGPTIGASYAKRLKEACPNFRWLKLEEPMMGAKVREILDATNGSVGVLEGWGGLYMIELLRSREQEAKGEVGICGIMPALSISDVLGEIYRLVREGRSGEANDLFEGLAPYILFSLQNMELYHHVEKQTLQARGVLDSPVVRDLRLTLDLETSARLNELIARVTQLARKVRTTR